MATYILHELVYSARLFKNMASWGFFVLVFESSGEPGDRPQETESGASCTSGTQFVVGRSTSCGEVAGASAGAPMEVSSSL